MRHFHTAFACLRGVLRVLLSAVFFPLASQAVILYGTGDPNANTTAPTGDYAGSGWAFQGQYGAFLGTMIAPQYFITAQHIGVSADNQFVSTAALNGGAVDVTYTIDTAANSGQGFWNIPGTDLRIFKINETFSSYAELYTGTLEDGMEMVVFGRGGPRGAEVNLTGNVQGWYHTGGDGVVRWGVNEVSSITSFGNGDLLRATFDQLGGANEATLSVGDSGGAVFVNDNGVWKLAGINYAVDGLFDINNVVDDNEFGAALFDRGGYFQGSDGEGWSGPFPDGSAAGFYASRISASAAQIQSIIAVPEPGAGLLVFLSLFWTLRRRRG